MPKESLPKEPLPPPGPRDYASVANPRFNRHDTIDCDVVFPAHGATPLPFTASPHDPEPHGREIFARCLAGEFGPVGRRAE